MATSLATFESRVQPIIRDRTSGTVTQDDIKESLNRCIRYLINRHGIHATKDLIDIKLFPSVYAYPLPSGFHDVIEIINRGTPTRFNRVTPVEFWKRLNSEDNMMAVDTILGTRFLLIKKSTAGSSNLLHDMDSLTANGTWAAASSSDATNLTEDTVTFKTGSGSINFDVVVATDANDYAAIDVTMATQDLSSMKDSGVLFFWAYIPDSTSITGFTARWGNDSSNYYSNTTTTQYNGEAIRGGWNRIGILWENSTETGTVTDTAIDYLHLQVDYAAAQADDTDFRFDDVRMENPDNMEVSFYSTNFCQTAAGTPQGVFSLSTDRSLLEDEDDDLLYYWALADAFWIKEEMEERKEALRLFEDLLNRFKARYSSERKRETRKYY